MPIASTLSRSESSWALSRSFALSREPKTSNAHERIVRVRLMPRRERRISSRNRGGNRFADRPFFGEDFVMPLGDIGGADRRPGETFALEREPADDEQHKNADRIIDHDVVRRLQTDPSDADDAEAGDDCNRFRPGAEFERPGRPPAL